MDWQERQDYYNRQHRAQDQNHENMLARRILRGFGYSNANRGVYTAEKQVLGVVRPDLPMWNRVLEILHACLRQTDYRDILRNTLIDAKLVETSAEAYERIDAIDWVADGVRPVLFTRIKGTEMCNVYTVWTPSEILRLTPPYVVEPADCYPAWLFTRQDAVHFVKQFAPYHNINTV